MSGGQEDASNDIESSGDWETPTVEHTWTPEACELRCTIREAVEIADGIAKRADERRQAEIERELCEGFDELVDTLKEENDAMEELDLSKPCEGLVGNKWIPCLHPPFHDVGTLYGTYMRVPNSVANHVWLSRAEIRNIRSPKYESHTMESLLPLANEWVRANESDVVVRIGSMTPKSVWIMGFRPSEWSYDELRIVLTWATGPHAGKPVAREVG